MPEIVRKHMDRRAWYGNGERSFVCRRVRDDAFRGGIGLLTFTAGKAPDTVDTPDGPLCIAAPGIRWLELVPEGGHWAATAMFRGGSMFQCYVDVTRRNIVAPDGNAVFDDLLLDVVLLPGGGVRVLDADELAAALESGTVTPDERDLAVRTADRIAAYWRENHASAQKRLLAYLAAFA